MPAMLEDPTAAAIFRTSGDEPYPQPGDELPQGIALRQVTLRDRVTIATLIPFHSPTQVPHALLSYLSDQFSREVEKGDTYPMIDPLPLEAFGPYWFGVFGAIMLLGRYENIEEVHAMANEGPDWEKACLGSFYIKPNYPGRSSHICNGGFLVTDGARNRGVGRLMGETYLEWAPKLGYTYSVFNLVYETNVASCRIWDALGFKRIGRVKGAGNLRSYPGELIDAIIYGRDLGQDDDFVSEERFDKIRFYLKNGKYPNGADRAEKSRLRSAATHYKLIPANGDSEERLMLKGKEVIADPQRQYEIARQVHHKSHGGINKTTAAIAEQFHWVRIKETVSQVIRNCPECSEMNKNLASSRNSFSTPRSVVGKSQSQNQNIRRTPSATSTSAPPVHNQPGRNSREESPSDQLQMEAAQQSSIVQGPYQHQQHQNFTPTPQNYTSTPQDYSPMPQQHQQHQQQQSQYTHYEMMPVDPALMGGGSLENLPPSPFLAAGRGLANVPQFSGLDTGIPTPDLPPPIARMTGDDVRMEGMDVQRAPTAGEELRRRMTRAGYRNK